MSYIIEIKGEGSRKDIGEALRLTANAIDGKGKYDMQEAIEINGAEWKDHTICTTKFEKND